jgi:serine/threonine protein kinase
LPIERTLDGKYRLERALGRGGFGAVFEASDLRLQRQVAAKVMMGALFGDAIALRRFEREARAAAKIDHPSITRVHDYGAVGSGGAYLIMELVAGRTWRAELQRSGLIAPARASGWFRQLLDGLQFAHAMLLQSEYHLPGASPEARALDAVVQRCLAKDPRDRYGSVLEVAHELVPAVAGWRGFEVRPSSSSPGTPTVG